MIVFPMQTLENVQDISTSNKIFLYSVPVN